MLLWLYVLSTTYFAVFAEAMAFRPDYGAIQAPILAFFADGHPEGFLAAGAPDSLRRRIENWHQDMYQPWQEEAIGRFRTSTPNAQVVFLENTSHSALPFEARDTIVAEMRRVLVEEGES